MADKKNLEQEKGRKRKQLEAEIDAENRRQLDAIAKQLDDSKRRRLDEFDQSYVEGSSSSIPTGTVPAAIQQIETNLDPHLYSTVTPGAPYPLQQNVSVPPYNVQTIGTQQNVGGAIEYHQQKVKVQIPDIDYVNVRQQKLNFDFDASTTVYELKEMICERLPSLTTDKQILTLRNKRLNQDKTLVEQGVRHNDELVLLPNRLGQ